MGIWMTNALLKANKISDSKHQSTKKLTTDINKVLERGIIRHLVVDSISSNWVVWNIFHIGISEIKCSIKQGGSDATNMWMLLSLDFMQFVHKFLVVRK